ncbi:hypothetical protein GCM10009681_16930 [Luedemannella helvata]|uniref:Uncharacterized protein n=1 Tax=Luedemannella helvata TaxID=349315 RepID=A0ABP4W6K0_9ACTN
MIQNVATQVTQRLGMGGASRRRTISGTARRVRPPAGLSSVRVSSFAASGVDRAWVTPRS